MASFEYFGKYWVSNTFKINPSTKKSMSVTVTMYM